MNWIPGSPRPALRQLQVPADAGTVRAWLADQERRERDWRSRSEVASDIRQSRATWLPNGAMRFESVQARGNVVAQHVIEDISIEEGSITRIMRGQATRRHRHTRWQLTQRITVESRGGAALVTVMVAGRPVGWSRVWHLLGFNDTTTARILTDQSTRWADFVVDSVGGHFRRPDEALD
jgi:hypothetical protein